MFWFALAGAGGLIAFLAWWFGTLGSANGPREPVGRSLAPEPVRPSSLTPRRVVVMGECEDGVFRAG